ncbi:MAG: hypothetical protein LRZ84_06670 [Desertifilum sp.]|nr:hypothetical protein [Desertifilum sp.]
MSQYRALAIACHYRSFSPCSTGCRAIGGRQTIDILAFAIPQLARSGCGGTQDPLTSEGQNDLKYSPLT